MESGKFSVRVEDEKWYVLDSFLKLLSSYSIFLVFIICTSLTRTYILNIIRRKLVQRYIMECDCEKGKL